MILDTNALSALADREPAVLRLLATVPLFAVPFTVVAEFRYGLLGSSRPENGLALLNKLIAARPVLFPDLETTDHYAWIADHLKRKGRQIPHNDIWLAALARQRSLAIISKDRHFSFIDDIQCVGW